MRKRVWAWAKALLGLAAFAWLVLGFLFRRGRETAKATEPEMQRRLSQEEQERGGDHEDEGRRRLLSFATVSAGGLVAAGIAGPPVFFIAAPMFRNEGPVWREVGRVGDFEVGETVKVTFDDPSPLPWSGVTARSAAWLRRVEEDEFEAFSIYCTHLGCAVRWVHTADLFMCPCHGGVFHRDGSMAAGPVRTPLAKHGVRIRAGMVEVQTLGLPITGPITDE